MRWRSALAGGLVAGIGWEVARLAYHWLAWLFLKGNPVYGALGGVALFLTWVYLSWCLLLFGARLSYAVEHAVHRGATLDLAHHPRTRELLATRIAVRVTRAQLQSAAGPTPAQLAAQLGVPAQLVGEVVQLLTAASLLKREKGGALRPAAEPSTLTVAQLSSAVGGVAMLVGRSGRSPGDAVEKIFSANDDASVENLSKISWKALALAPEGL